MNGLILLGMNEMEEAVTIRKKLEDADYVVHSADHLSQVLTMIHQVDFDMLIIDSHLAGMRDFDLVRRMQKGRRRIPIIVVGREGSSEAAASLEAGANDYISCQADGRELLARVNNLFIMFNYGAKQRIQKIEVGDLQIDPLSRGVNRAGDTIVLTQREYDLLLYLTSRVNEVCSREEILSHVWDYDFHTGTNVVDVYILHLREKIDKGRKWKMIRTIRGAGYMLKTSEEDI